MRCGGILRGVEFGARPIGGNRLRGRPRSRGVGQPTEYAVDAFEESGGITHVWVGGHHVGKEFGVVGVRGTAAVTSWRLAHSICDFCDGKDLSMFGFARNSG